MIIPNGTIEFKTKSAGGIDPETGYPIKPTSVAWGDPIECQYLVNKYNQLAKTKSEPYTQATYSVLIESDRHIEGEQVRLKDKAGKTVGEFSVIQVEPLDAVCEVRIWI